ncbi:SP_0198 family lipoprotein [Streptococcus sp. Marseille-Q6504]
MSLKKFTLSLASLASLSLLVACSPKEQAAPSTQASTSPEVTTAQSAETTVSSSTASSVTNIDGTYKGQDEGDSITLVVTGNTGTWTEVEADGDQEIKKVTFEPENQRVFIGDDIKVYVADGNQMIIDDMGREISDRIVLKK